MKSHPGCFMLRTGDSLCPGRKGWQGSVVPFSVHLYRVLHNHFPMEKTQQAIKVKHDCPICEKCQASSIRTRPDGSYRCNRCGFDSAKGKK